MGCIARFRQHSKRNFIPSISYFFALFFLVTLSSCDSRLSSPATATLHMSVAHLKENSPHSAISGGDSLSSLTRFQLEVIDEQNVVVANEIFSLANPTVTIAVPINTNMKVTGRAFAGDSLLFQGSAKIPPLDVGQSYPLSFNLYDQASHPIQIDIGLANTPSNGRSKGLQFSLSRDYVLFVSDANNLVENDDNENADLFLRDLSTESNINLETSTGNLQSTIDDFPISEVDISADGRYVVFSSTRSDIVEGDTNDVSDVFIKDVLTGITNRITLTTGSADTPEGNYQPQISNDGRYILFQSDTSLVEGDSSHAYVYDRIQQRIISTVENIISARLSGDGSSVVYESLIDGSLMHLITSSGNIRKIVDFRGVLPDESQLMENSGNTNFQYDIDRSGQYVVFISRTSSQEINANRIYRYDSAINTLLPAISDGPSFNASQALSLGVSEDGNIVAFHTDNVIYSINVSTGRWEAIADGNRPFVNHDGSKIGFTDLDGRLMLRENPLFLKADASIPSANTKPGSITVDSENNEQFSWAPIDESSYYRVYLGTEPGVMPESISTESNVKQFEVTEPNFSVPLNQFNESQFYVVVTAVSNDGESAPSDEFNFSVPFAVESVSPVDAASNIDVTTVIQVKFERDIVAASLSENSVTLAKESEGVPIEIEIVDATTVLLKPLTSLDYNTTYHLSITDSVIDTQGTAITPFVSQFSTESPPNNTTQFTVFVNQRPGGMILPDNNVVLGEGEVARFNVIADEGYDIEAVIGCNGTLFSNGEYVTDAVTTDCTVDADFIKKRFDVTSIAGLGGSITPQTTQQIPFGESAMFTVVSDLGYEVASVVGCSGTLVGSSFTTDTITQSCSIQANFQATNYIVSPMLVSGGSISPNLPQTVPYNTSLTFDITPEPGNEIASVTGCGGILSNNSYTIASVTSDCSIDAIFQLTSYSVSPLVVGEGSIIPNTIQQINYGETALFNLSPILGHYLESVSGCNGVLLDNGDYVTENILADCSVTATFLPETYTVNVNSNAGGSLSPSIPFSVVHGSRYTIDLLPDLGYHIESIAGCNGVLADNQYTFVATGNCSVDAVFAVNVYTVTQNIVGGGSVTPSATQLVEHGMPLAYSMLADPEFLIASASGCNGTLTGDTYEIPSVTSDCTISFNFDAFDSTPNVFTFPVLLDAELNTLVTSSEVVIEGINVPTDISVIDGFYSINGSAFTDLPGIINNGDLLRLQHTSSTAYGNTIFSFVVVGTRSQNFSSRTVINQAPEFISIPGIINIDENNPLTNYFPVVSDNENEDIKFSTGGVDGYLFEVNPLTQQLEFSSKPDYENAADENGDNTYELNVLAADEYGNTSTQAITVIVNNLNSDPTIELLFPTSGSNLGRGYEVNSTIMVKVLDLENANETVDSVFANGVSLSNSIAQPNVWFTSLPFAGGTHALNIEANFSNLTNINKPLVFENQAAIGDIQGLQYVSEFDQLYMSDSASDSIIKLDLASKNRVIVSDLQKGTGKDFLRPVKFRLYNNGNNMYVSDYHQYMVHDIDLATGNRTEASNRVGIPYGLELKSNSDEIFVTSDFFGYISSINVLDRVVTRFSDDISAGLGADLNWPRDIVANDDYSQYIVSAFRPTSIYFLDPLTGDRESIYNVDVSDPLNVISDPYALEWDVAKNKLYIGEEDDIFSLDMNTGLHTREFTLPVPTKVTALELDTVNNRLFTAHSGYTLSEINTTNFQESIILTANIGGGDKFSSPLGSVIDTKNNLLYVGDDFNIFKVNPSSGNRTSIYKSLVGGFWDFSLDDINDRLFCACVNHISSIDLKTGMLTTHVSAGPVLYQFYSVTTDSSKTNAYFVSASRVDNNSVVSIVRLNIETGETQVISDDTIGTGPTLDSVFQIVWDSNNNRLLAPSSNTVLSIDPFSGNRTVITDNTNIGPTIANVRVAGMDAINNKLYIVTNSASNSPMALQVVDLETGDRELVSEPNIKGSGVAFRNVTSLAVDTENHRVFVVDSNEGLMGMINVNTITGDRSILSK